MKFISSSTSGVILGICWILICICVIVLVILFLEAFNARNKDEETKALNVQKKENNDFINNPRVEDKNNDGLQESINDAAVSRSASGVILGICCILICICVVVVSILGLEALKATNKAEETKENNDFINNPWVEDKNNDGLQESINDACVAIGNTVFITILVVALILIIISALLIVGIVKRRHALMAPWKFVTALYLFGAIAAVISIGEIMPTFIIKSLTLCLTAFIVYTIYTVYIDIRDKTNGLLEKLVSAGEQFLNLITQYTGVPQND